MTHSDDQRTADETVVSIRDASYAWARGRTVLDVAAFDVAAGERVFLRGPSGSGKSTLLGLVAGVLAPQKGRIEVLGARFDQASGPARDELRAREMGVVFQLFNLLPFLSVLDNVTLPCRFSAARRAKAAKAEGSPEAAARRLLERLGLDKSLHGRRSSDLSVGQQQRVAAARALIGGPKLVIADEPTSALDADARDAFIDLLLSEAGASGAAVLFVSHDGGLASAFDRADDLADLNRAFGLEGRAA